MAQTGLTELLMQSDRLGLRLVAGPTESPPIERVDIAELDEVDRQTPGALVIVTTDDVPAPYRLDVAVRQASARRVAGLVFTHDLEVAETARTLAERGGVPLVVAPGARPADLAVAVDRLLSGGASETMTRASYAIGQATEAAALPDASVESVLAAACTPLGVALTLSEDPSVGWTDSDAVCVGEVPVGRLVSAVDDDAAEVALPVVAALLSRVAQRWMRDRFAPTQSRADLLVALVLAESSRVEGFVGQAARLGFPLQLAHAVGWLTPTTRTDPDAHHLPREVPPALELFALQLVEGHEEMWHVAFVQDAVLLVCTEEHGAGDHQRRLREVAERLQTHAGLLAGPGWTWTLGLGTPQLGANGLRQSAAEARIAAESAVAAGRTGGVELTDVTGLRRVLLDFYASPISRRLLDDILAPLDRLGPDRAAVAVRTLLAYLSHRNSLARAGEELTLHPNAVGYRLKGIREALRLDLDDPDVRFAVELACRVRLLGSTP